METRTKKQRQRNLFAVTSEGFVIVATNNSLSDNK